MPTPSVSEKLLTLAAEYLERAAGSPPLRSSHRVGSQEGPINEGELAEAVAEVAGNEFVGLGMRDGIFPGGVMGALVTLSVTGAVHWLRLQRSLARPRKKRLLAARECMDQSTRSK